MPLKYFPHARKRFFLLFLIVLFILPVCVFAQKSLSTAVYGFQNKGGRLDDNLNSVITKSLINFLSRIDGYSAISFEAVQDFLLESKPISTNGQINNQGRELFRRFNTDTVISGEYQVNPVKNTITIVVRVFSEKEEKPLFEKHYSSDMGVAFFDNLDQMIGDVSSILTGRLVTTAKLNLSVRNTERLYDLSINGVFQKTVGVETRFSDIVPANEPLLVTISKRSLKEPLFSKTIFLKTDDSSEILFEPAGMLELKAPDFIGNTILVNGSKAGILNNDGTFFAAGIPAMDHTCILAVNQAGTNLSVLVDIAENKTNTVQLYPSFYFRFPIQLLNGGYGGTAGVEFYPTHFFKISAQGGAVYVLNTLILTADAGISVKAAEISLCRLWLIAGCFSYFASPVLCSPYLKLEVGIGMFFLQGGFRYGLDDGVLYPMGGIGVRF